MLESRHQKIQQKMRDPRVREAEKLACEIFAHKGYKVYSKFNDEYAETEKQIEEKSDRGDIIIFYEDNPAIIEVKRLSSDNIFAYFQEPKDFFNGVIVDGVKQFEDKMQRSLKPFWYVCFNAPMTFGFIVKTSDRENWTIKKYNGNEGIKDYYMSKAVDCRFFKTEDQLHG